MDFMSLILYSLIGALNIGTPASVPVDPVPTEEVVVTDDVPITVPSSEVQEP